MKNLYEIKNALNGGAELYLNGGVGDDINPAQLIEDLTPHKGKALTVYINSGGGYVTDGLAIYHYLRSHFSDLTTYNLGFCASIASIIFLAGTKRVMPENSFFVIHKPWALTVGNADDLQKQIKTLDTIEAELVDIYVKNSAYTEDEIKAFLADETWFNGKDCLEAGFATELAEAQRQSAMIDLKCFNKVPAELRAKVEEPQEETEEEPAEETKDEQEKIGDVILEEKNETKAELDLPKESVNMDDLTTIQDKVNPDLEIMNVLKTKPQNAALTLSDGYGVPTAVGGEILRLRDKGSFFRAAGGRRVSLATLTALTFNPNSGPAQFVTGNYPDLTTAGAKITATPQKLGGRYIAKEEVNDFSVLSVLDNFKIDAGRALAKGENKQFLDAVIAKASTLEVTSGAWTQAKLAEVYAKLGADYLGTPGAWFLNPANLGLLMAVQTNGAGSPLLFIPEYNTTDGRVGTLMGQPVFVHASVVASGATTKRLWYVAMDAIVIADFAGGGMKGVAGTDPASNDLYINYNEYVDFHVADVNGVCAMVFA